MRSLSDIYNYYRYSFPEYKRQLKRERGMVDTTALVSIDEFLEKIVIPFVNIPPAEEKNPFAKLFKSYAKRIENTLFYWASHERIESENIQWHMMNENSQSLMKKRYERQTPPLNMSNKVQTLEEIRDLIKGVGSLEGGSLKQSFSKEVESKRYPALYLGHIVQAIDIVTETENVLLKVESVSLWRGYAQEALDFWKSVNSLKDYSSFFPNKPKPRGDTRDDNGGRVKVTGWKPAFGF